MYCATTDPVMAQQGLAQIDKILTENYVRPDESEAIKSKIRELGQYTIIDKVQAHLDEYQDIYVSQLTNLNIEPFVMPAEYVRKYTKILMGGIWCIMRIEYLRVEDMELDDPFGEQPKPKAGRKGKKRGPRILPSTS